LQLETDTGDENSVERRLIYDADVGRPSFERQKETDTGDDTSVERRLIYDANIGQPNFAIRD
jgi:hypothetical protein